MYATAAASGCEDILSLEGSHLKEDVLLLYELVFRLLLTDVPAGCDNWYIILDDACPLGEIAGFVVVGFV